MKTIFKQLQEAWFTNKIEDPIFGELKEIKSGKNLFYTKKINIGPYKDVTLVLYLSQGIPANHHVVKKYNYAKSKISELTKNVCKWCCNSKTTPFFDGVEPNLKTVSQELKVYSVVITDLPGSFFVITYIQKDDQNDHMWDLMTDHVLVADFKNGQLQTVGLEG